MKALIELVSSLPLSAAWSKIKMALLISAVSFMVWQGWQMSSLQKDVTNLEAVQSNLQAQVQQMSVDYSMLRKSYQNSARTGEQYLNSVNELNGKSMQLEKDFSALEKKALSASHKADTALSLHKGTTPRVSNETSSTQARTSPVEDASSGASGSDAEWRQLLDNTYCSVYPTDINCPK